MLKSLLQSIFGRDDQHPLTSGHPNKKMERFTQRARRVLLLADEEANRRRATAIETEHILIALMREEGGIACHVMNNLGISLADVESAVNRLSPPGQTPDDAVKLSERVKKMLELTVDEARRIRSSFIGTEHLLMGLVRQKDGMAVEILKQRGITPEAIRRETHRILWESPILDIDIPADRTRLADLFRQAGQLERRKVHIVAVDSTTQESRLDTTVPLEQLLNGIDQMIDAAASNPSTSHEFSVGNVTVKLDFRTDDDKDKDEE